MGEAKRREIVYNSLLLKGEEFKFDFKELIPKYPHYTPRAKWGWCCFMVFNDANEVVDLVSVKLDGSKGFSHAHGELDYGKLQDAKEMWRELVGCDFRKRIVNGSLLY